MYYFLLFINFLVFVQVNSSIIESISGSNTTKAIIRRDLKFPERVEYDGYKSELHRVTTSDGYVLSLFRVSKPGACNAEDSGARCGAEPVVFTHGLYLSGDDCVTPGPGAAHCYLYADACCDVWVPNMRGNLYSREHVTLDPDTDPKFWDFSFDEMALYDMPAIIDYILEETGQKQIVFVGHSQGPASLLLLCAKKPEYNAKVKVAFGLSMTAWLYHARFIVIQLQGALAPLLTPAINAGANMEFLPRDAFYQPIAKSLCGTTDASYLPCSAFYFAVLGYDDFQVTQDVFKVLTGHLPSGTSLKNFNRWGQIRQNGFTEYDYGVVGNLKTYGRVKPPEIDLSNVTLKWLFIGSENDYVADVQDLDILTPKLLDATTCIVSDKTLGHLDYLFGKGVAKLVVPMVLNYLDTGKFTCL